MTQYDPTNLDSVHRNFTLVPFGITGDLDLNRLFKRPIKFIHKLGEKQKSFEPFLAFNDKNSVAQHFELVGETQPVPMDVSIPEIEQRIKWNIWPFSISYDVRTIRYYRENEYVYLEEKVFHAFIVQIVEGSLPNLEHDSISSLLFIATNIHQTRILTQYLDAAMKHFGLETSIYALNMSAADLEDINSQIASRRVRTNYRIEGQEGVEELMIKGEQPQPVEVILTDAGLGLEMTRSDGYIMLPGNTEVYGHITDCAGLHVKHNVMLSLPIALSLSYIIPKIRAFYRIEGIAQMQLLIDATRNDLDDD